MTSSKRREKITQLLQGADGPLSASLLAETLCVSRQIIVGDVALLRAGNSPIVATPRGYVIEQSHDISNIYTIACKHPKTALLSELYCIVDCGCAVLDVTVEHPVYGQISGQLHIKSRYDADLFHQKLCESDAQPLSSLTGNTHLHTISCPSKEHYDNLCLALSKKKLLADSE